MFDEKEFLREAEKEVMDQVDKELDDLVDAVFAKSQKLLDLRKTRTSRTGRTFTSQTTDTGFLAGMGKVIKEYLKKTIIYAAPYSAAIEFGSSPHWPPVDELVGWAKRKLHVEPTEVNKVAYRIARSISIHGTDPQPFLRPALNEFVLQGDIEYELGVGL